MKSKKAANAYKKFKKTMDQADMDSWERDEDDEGKHQMPQDMFDEIEDDEENDDDYVPPKYSKDKEDDDFDDVPD